MFFLNKNTINVEGKTERSDNEPSMLKQGLELPIK